MVVDVSGSMRALDLSVKGQDGIRHRTRLDAVKETFGKFVEKRPNDLMGLITFGGYVTTRAPLTPDHAILLHLLHAVEIPGGAYGKDGQRMNKEELLTAIGDALATACARLQHAEPRSKIIVVLSDGESNAGVVKPEEAMRAAKELGIKVYTIGIGTTDRTPFWQTDASGTRKIVYGRVSLDEELLRDMAENTGGQYFNVRSSEGLEKALEDINNLERTQIEAEMYTRYHELSVWFLIAAAVLIVLGSSLTMLFAGRII